MRSFIMRILNARITVKYWLITTTLIFIIPGCVQLVIWKFLPQLPVVPLKATITSAKKVQTAQPYIIKSLADIIDTSTAGSMMTIAQAPQKTRTVYYEKSTHHMLVRIDIPADQHVAAQRYDFLIIEPVEWKECDHIEVTKLRSQPPAGLKAFQRAANLIGDVFGRGF